MRIVCVGIVVGIVGCCSAVYGELQGAARIQEDLKAGRISYETSLLYRAYAFFEPSKVPPEYRDEARLVKCGTPLASEVRTVWPALSVSAKAVLASFYSRPDYLPESYLSPSERFRIHYTRSGSDKVPPEDSNGNEVPDYVETAAVAFDSAYVLEVEQLGYREPVRDGTDGGDQAWDVYVRNLWGTRVYGYTTPERRTGSAYGYTSFVEIDNDFEDGYPTKGLDALRVTAAHEFFHIIHFSYYGLGGLDWWMEICSTWMEDVAYTEVNDYYEYLRYFFDFPDQPLDTQNSGHEYGASVFAHYLSLRFGPDVIRQIWERIGASGQANISSFDRVIPGGIGSAMKEFALWNYFTGSRAQPDRYYPEGAEYPEIKIEEEHTTYPAAGEGHVRHLAAHYIQFLETQDKPGGLSLTFDPEGSELWGALVGLSPSNEDTTWSVSSGRGTIVGWDAFQEIALISVATSPTGYSFRYAYSGTYDPGLTDEEVPENPSLGQSYPNPFLVGARETDEVRVPFDLAAPGKVTLSIYTLQGALVRRIELGVLVPRHYEDWARWRGENERGNLVSSGIYLVRLEVQSDSGNFETVRKMAVIRGE